MLVISEYTICYDVREVNFVENVNLHIKNGWEPWGHPFVKPNGNGGFVIYQAMVKYAMPVPKTAVTINPENGEQINAQQS